MQKIACVCSFDPSSWVSCQKIVSNLLASYEALPGVELLRFNYHGDLSESQVVELAEGLHDAAPDVIVILDHKPHPLALFQKYFGHVKASKKVPRILVHVFGDFTLYYKEWAKLEKLLATQAVEFVVASERQKHLIDKFVPTPSHVVPFPVATKEFFFQDSERRRQRAEWNVDDDEAVFVFTGRLSRQKRIHSLLKCFSHFLDTKKTKARLFLYGVTDHIGDSFVGKWEVEGEYFRKLHRLYQSLPEASRNRIHFMGAVPNSELRSVYNGADVLVNLSVHNDEDYGMSVAEAICSGLPAILTDWGGLASFASTTFPAAIRYVPVSIGRKHKVFSLAEVERTLDEVTAKPFRDRAKLALEGQARFGVGAQTERLKEILRREPPRFTSFSPFFHEVVRRHEIGPTVYLSKQNLISSLYRKIYNSYVRPT